ncbi:GFA family protein [Sphingomonas telluris]|uniref:GFA family protein n=1 Tax=Sphingomonas telluris TaxID=2907998 RepID=UPI00344F1828
MRNTCSSCGSFVFGGARASSDWDTIYAGSLDDSSLFEPQMAIFMKDRAPWAHVPDGRSVLRDTSGSRR